MLFFGICQKEKIGIVIAYNSLYHCTVSAVGYFISQFTAFAFQLIFVIAIRTEEIGNGFVVFELLDTRESASRTIHIPKHPIFRYNSYSLGL